MADREVNVQINLSEGGNFTQSMGKAQESLREIRRQRDALETPAAARLMDVELEKMQRLARLDYERIALAQKARQNPAYIARQEQVNQLGWQNTFNAIAAARATNRSGLGINATHNEVLVEHETEMASREQSRIKKNIAFEYDQKRIAEQRAFNRSPEGKNAIQNQATLGYQQSQADKEETKIQQLSRLRAEYGKIGGTLKTTGEQMKGFSTGLAQSFFVLKGSVLGFAAAAGPAAFGTFAKSAQLAAGEIGLILTPTVIRLSAILQDSARWIRSWSDSTKGMIGTAATWGIAITGMAAAGQLLINVGGRILTTMAGVIGVLRMIPGVAAVARAGLIGVGIGGLTMAATTASAVPGGISRPGVPASPGGTAVVPGGGMGIRGAVATAGVIYVASEALRDPLGTAAAASAGGANLDQISNRIHEHAATVNAQRAQQGLPPLQPIQSPGEGGIANIASRIARAARGESGDRPAIDTGFQSRQMDIFSLHDTIQQESVRDSLAQQTFDLQMRTLEEATRTADAVVGAAEALVGTEGLVGAAQRIAAMLQF